MAECVKLNLDERSYEIHLGHGLGAGMSLAHETDVTALLVSDSNVAPLYADRFAAHLEAQGLKVSQAVVPAGEPSKSLTVAGDLYAAAVEAGLDRRSVIVALGGGMVGDLAGFVAATFLRGIRLLQIPTSLLAMVDSSVGGKTAVDLPHGKNLVGVFHQPIEVIADLDTLATLPDREYRSGLGEVVKYGVIWDAALFRLLVQEADALVNRDPAVLLPVIKRCCEIKAEVVAMDERESGVRAILNFGHTCGHAIEQVTGYDTWLHGEAVSLGMVYAALLSEAEWKFPADSREQLVALLERLELPVRLATPPAWADVRAAMSADKKTRGRVPFFVLAEHVGQVAFGCEIPEAALEAAWDQFVA